MSSDDVAIRVDGLGKCYQIYAQPRDRLKQFIYPRLQRWTGQAPKNYFREFWALRNVSFEVKKGETVGIVGRNGSGKSTLLQLICGTLSPTAGTIETRGRVAALLELGSGFNPEFTGRENVYLNGSVLGFSREEIDQRFDDIAAFADIGDFIDQPIKTYSSGMVVRLAFSVQVAVDPEVLVVDEALAVGDAAFQRKCLRRLEELSQRGLTTLFVSHDTNTVRTVCSEAIYLGRGMIVGRGTTKEVCTEYERDLFGASRAAGQTPQAATEGGAQRVPPTLDESLLMVDEKTYGDGRAEIVEILMTNQHGQRQNILEPKVAMNISYRARFLSRVERPVFGMMITTREGVCVFGTNTAHLEVSRGEYSAGDEARISFHLSNNLCPGTYYLTCGIHSSDGGDGLIYLQRRMDVLIFRCIGHAGEAVGGTAYLNPGIEASVFKGGK